MQATDNISPYEFDLITSKRIIQEFTKPSHLRRFDLPIYLLHYHTVRKYGFFFFKFSPEIFVYLKIILHILSDCISKKLASTVPLRKLNTLLRKTRIF